MSATFEGQNPLVRAPTQNAFKQSGRVLTLSDGQRWYRQVYLHSDHWQELRARKFRQAPKCYMCGSTERIDVHHLSYANLGHEKLNELMCLCRPCHELEHAKLPESEKIERERQIMARAAYERAEAKRLKTAERLEQLSSDGPRGFPRPRTKWLKISEHDRHSFFNSKNIGAQTLRPAQSRDKSAGFGH